VILDLRTRREATCPELNRIEETGKSRLEEMLCFEKLGTCSDRMTKSTKFWNSAGVNHFGVAFSRKLLISCVRDAEHFQSSSGNFRSIGILEAFFDMAVSRADEEKFLPIGLSAWFI
jgi:hypothetical protein